MKKIAGLVIMILLLAVFSVVHAAEEVKLGENTTLHDVIVSSAPANVEVVSPYKKSIRLHRLKKDEVAYWTPEGGRYISAGEYAYLWCRVYKKDNGQPQFHWVAVTKEALDTAQEVGSRYKGGVAFYQLIYDGEVIRFRTYLYTTLHAVAEGRKIMDVK
jgi:hypothetical protein